MSVCVCDFDGKSGDDCGKKFAVKAVTKLNQYFLLSQLILFCFKINILHLLLSCWLVGLIVTN